MSSSNHTCPSEWKPNDPTPFYTNGTLNFKAHDVGWIVCGFFTLIASGASFWLIWKHLTYYTCPQQQRHIVRMLFMVPIYAAVSLLSYIFYRHAIYYQTIRDCYEAVVITSFFCLLLQYVGDTPAEQHEVFRMVKLKKWFFPLNYWKYRPNGLHFLWLMKVCILQYAIVRPLCTLVAVGLQYFGLYCLESWEPYFGHIYISIAISVSVSVAMYCVIQFYLPIQEELKPYSPVLKFLAVKSVVFLTFWQDSFLSILVYFGAIKESEYMSAADIQVGINALLETFEMALFGFLHIKAFTYLIYRPKDHSRTTRRWKAFVDVLDYRDWWYQMRQTSRYVVARSKGQTFTIAQDIQREKYTHLENALGRDRLIDLERHRQQGKEQMPSFWSKGCEPTGREEDEEEKSDLVRRKQEEEACLDEKALFIPRGTAAMHAEYDPEQEYDDEDEAKPFDLDMGELQKEEVEEEAKKNEASSLDFQPTLPAIDVDSIRAPLRPVRRPTLVLKDDDDDDKRASPDRLSIDKHAQEEDIFIPRKGTRVRKEASGGFSGAFWRSFRQRISGGAEGEEGGEATSSRVVREADETQGSTSAAPFIPPAPHQLHPASDFIHFDSSPSVHADNAAQASSALPTVPQIEAGRRHRIEEYKGVDRTTSLSSASYQSGQPVKLHGPKGRAIALVLPKPLSPGTSMQMPFVHPPIGTPRQGSARHSSNVSARNKAITEQLSSTSKGNSSTSRIRFAEQRPAQRYAKDDPEAEPPNFTGFVIAGGQSLKQARSKVAATSASVRQDPGNRITGRPSPPQSQPWGAPSDLLVGETVYNRYTGEPQRSILQSSLRHSHRRSAQNVPGPESRRSSDALSPHQVGWQSSAPSSSLPSSRDRHRQSQNTPRASSRQQGRHEEIREGFQFEYVD